MHNPFEMTDEEKDSSASPQQLAMFQRLVDFVNERLSEIETLQTEMTDAKSDIDDLKNPTPTKTKK